VLYMRLHAKILTIKAENVVYQPAYSANSNIRQLVLLTSTMVFRHQALLLPRMNVSCERLSILEMWRYRLAFVSNMKTCKIFYGSFSYSLPFPTIFDIALRI
jgi:hypothetical protein